jgi:hypothetical protein
MVILDIDMGDEANDMGDDSIDTVISHIDMGYLVTLGQGRGRRVSWRAAVARSWAVQRQGLTLVPISAQLDLTLPLSAKLKLTLPPI